MEGIQPSFLGCLDQAVNHRAGLGAQRGIGKQEVLAANHKGLDAVLRPVVAQFQPSILQISQEIGPLLLEVMQSFAQRGLGCGRDRIRPRQGVWGQCTAYEYGFTGAGSSAHPASGVQKIILGELEVTTEDSYTLIVKKVDSTNPSNRGAYQRRSV